MGKGTQRVENILPTKDGWLVARCSYLPLEKCFSENEMSAGDQSCLQHLNNSANWTWNDYNARVVHRWVTKILRLVFRPKMQPGEEWVTYKVRIARMLRTRWKKLGLPSLAELCAEKVWKMMVWAVFYGEVLVLKSIIDLLLVGKRRHGRETRKCGAL